MTSDWKWTGPAEPMVRLARGLREMGHRVLLAAPPPPSAGVRNLEEEAKSAGFSLARKLSYSHGTRPLSDRRDIQVLRELVTSNDISIVHTWHTRDHILAWRALGILPRTRRAKLVRSYKTGEAILKHPPNRALFGLGCDGLICVSPSFARINGEICAGPVSGLFGAVDTARYRPAPKKKEVMDSLGLASDHHVVGIVARGQRRRRFPLLLKAAKYLFESDPAARLLIIGRGTNRKEVAEDPARELGISDRVIFAGYRVEDYLDVVRCIDVFTFLVPGSDGTCRAVLEALSLGIPVVTTRRGSLPEIVLEGKTGLLSKESPEGLAENWKFLLSDQNLRQKMGDAAREDALGRFQIERFSQEVERFYYRTLGINQAMISSEPPPCKDRSSL